MRMQVTMTSVCFRKWPNHPNSGMMKSKSGSMLTVERGRTPAGHLGSKIIKDIVKNVLYFFLPSWQAHERKLWFNGNHLVLLSVQYNRIQ